MLFETPSVHEPGHAVGNASISWRNKVDTWSIRLFVDNVGDEEYILQAFDLSVNIDSGGILIGMIEQYYAKPRTWGVRFNYSWGS